MRKGDERGRTARLRSATENVERTLHKLAETLYKANEAGKGQADAASAGASGGSAAGAAQSNKPGDVIDAEYVDVDESKRPN